MTLVINAKGSSENGRGEWSYTVEERTANGEPELLHTETGVSSGTTSRQMRLMAILKGLSYVKSLDMGLPVLVISDCIWCVKCIKKEFDCVSDNEFKRDKVSRGYVQYLQEIWWKLGEMPVEFQIDANHGN
jgi:ribonuclease HI